MSEQQKKVNERKPSDRILKAMKNIKTNYTSAVAKELAEERLAEVAKFGRWHTNADGEEVQKFHILHHIPVTEYSFIMKGDYELRRREDGHAVGHVCLIDKEVNVEGKEGEGWRSEMNITPERLGLLAQACIDAGVDWPEEPRQHVSGYEIIVPEERLAYIVSKVVDDEPKHARGRQQTTKAVELRSATSNFVFNSSLERKGGASRDVVLAHRKDEDVTMAVTLHAYNDWGMSLKVDLTGTDRAVYNAIASHYMAGIEVITYDDIARMVFEPKAQRGRRSGKVTDAQREIVEQSVIKLSYVEATFNMKVYKELYGDRLPGEAYGMTYPCSIERRKLLGCVRADDIRLPTGQTKDGIFFETGNIWNDMPMLAHDQLLGHFETCPRDMLKPAAQASAAKRNLIDLREDIHSRLALMPWTEHPEDEKDKYTIRSESLIDKYADPTDETHEPTRTLGKAEDFLNGYAEGGYIEGYECIESPTDGSLDWLVHPGEWKKAEEEEERRRRQKGKGGKKD